MTINRNNSHTPPIPPRDTDSAGSVQQNEQARRSSNGSLGVASVRSSEARSETGSASAAPRSFSQRVSSFFRGLCSCFSCYRSSSNAGTGHDNGGFEEELTYAELNFPEIGHGGRGPAPPPAAPETEYAELKGVPKADNSKADKSKTSDGKRPGPSDSGDVIYTDVRAQPQPQQPPPPAGDSVIYVQVHNGPAPADGRGTPPARTSTPSTPQPRTPTPTQQPENPYMNVMGTGSKTKPAVLPKPVLPTGPALPPRGTSSGSRGASPVASGTPPPVPPHATTPLPLPRGASSDGRNTPPMPSSGPLPPPRDSSKQGPLPKQASTLQFGGGKPPVGGASNAGYESDEDIFADPKDLRAQMRRGGDVIPPRNVTPPLPLSPEIEVIDEDIFASAEDLMYQREETEASAAVTEELLAALPKDGKGLIKVDIKSNGVTKLEPSKKGKVSNEIGRFVLVKHADVSGLWQLSMTAGARNPGTNPVANKDTLTRFAGNHTVSVNGQNYVFSMRDNGTGTVMRADALDDDVEYTAL